MAKKNSVLVPAICPQCGAQIELANNLEKGFCSFCGTEIIIKDVVKKVKIVNNPTFDNYIKLGDRAYDDKDYGKAQDNYKQALAINPDDWKATYREGICTARESNLASFNLDKAVISSKNALKILEEMKISDEELAKHKVQMAHDLIGLCIDFFNFAFNHYSEFWTLENSASEMWGRIMVVRDASNYVVKKLFTDEVISLCPKDDDGESTEKWKSLALKEVVTCDVTICEVRKYKSGYSQYGDIYSNTWIKPELRAELVNEYDEYVALIKSIEPDYVPQEINRTGKAKGCYVATAVYGSYDCSEVWVLRRYRDFKLSKSWYGRAFINFYYSVSPTIVKWFGNKKIFNKIIKPKLDKFVNKLQQKGYENTPYDDINW